MKRIKIFIITTILIILCGLSSKSTLAAETIPSALKYTLGTTQYGIITENGEEKQYYKIVLDTSGYINISGTAHMQNINLYLYDENGNELSSNHLEWNSISELITISGGHYLTKGIYYFCVEKSYGKIGEFNFKIDFISTNETFTELNGGSNNTINTANTVSTDGTQYIAQIAQNDEKDFFKFVLNDSGKINLKATFYMVFVNWYLYDEDGNELVSSNPEWNSTTENITIDTDIHITKGTYYFTVSRASNYRGIFYGNYKFTLNFINAKESFPEKNGGTNNNIRETSPIKLDTTYLGQIAINDDNDFYSFNLPSSKTLSINLTAEIGVINIILYDKDGNEIFGENLSWNDTTKKIHYTKITTLSVGTYYLTVSKNSDYRGAFYGNYELSVNNLTPLNCDHDFDDKYIDATYFSQGYRLYTCKICGYSYKDDYSAKLVLAQGYFYIDCYTGKGKMYLSWSTVNDATGYQIRYSKDKSFKTGVTVKNIESYPNNSITISKLSRKKKYYVQIRPYIKFFTKTAYGKWSGKISLKTK